MVERQDIDALLISALYGELTPTEETRLAAHLDSHPGDRTALADLTHARGLVRESRLLQVQLDPPPSVSALLMKEAARCAPKPQVQDGWFARFVRSFAAHPAMAAAAMLVVVLGVATFVTKRKGDQFAESTAPSQGTIQTEDQVAREKMTADSPQLQNAAPTGAAMGSGSAAYARAESASSETAAVEAKADNYRVALEEGAAADHGKDGESDKLSDAKKSAKADPAAIAKPTTDRKPNLQLAKEQQEVAIGGEKKKQEGIEVRTPQAAPKDFDDSREKGGKTTKNDLAFGGENDDVTVAKPAPATPAPSTGASVGTASGGGAPGAVSNRGYAQPMQPSTSTATTTPSVPRVTTKAPLAQGSTAPAPPPAPPKAEPRRDAPAKTVDRNATPRAAAPAEDKPADPQLAWARDQHAALIAQVRAGDCKKAATLATAISNRAPAYYQQNVETDRSVKACIAYINSERERDAEQRSERARANQKRSLNESSPAKAAPSKPTAADTTTK